MSESVAEHKQSDFSKLAQKKRSSFVSEFWSFLKHNKKWWLVPILVTLLLLGLIILIGGTSIAPFIYPLF